MVSSGAPQTQNKIPLHNTQYQLSNETPINTNHQHNLPNSNNAPQFNSRYIDENFENTKPLFPDSYVDSRNDSLNSLGSGSHSPTSTRHPSRAFTGPISPSSSQQQSPLPPITQAAPRGLNTPTFASNDLTQTPFPLPIPLPPSTIESSTTPRRSSSSQQSPNYSHFSQPSRSSTIVDKSSTLASKIKKSRRPTALLNRFIPSRRESEPTTHHAYLKKRGSASSAQLSRLSGRKPEPENNHPHFRFFSDNGSGYPDDLNGGLKNSATFTKQQQHPQIAPESRYVEPQSPLIQEELPQPPRSSTSYTTSAPIPPQLQQSVPLPQRIHQQPPPSPSLSSSHPNPTETVQERPQEPSESQSSTPIPQQRREQSKSEIKFQQPFGIDLNSDNEDISEITRLSDVGMSRMGSMASFSPQVGSFERPSWRAPESWKVKTTNEELTGVVPGTTARTSVPMSSSRSNSSTSSTSSTSNSVTDSSSENQINTSSTGINNSLQMSTAPSMSSSPPPTSSMNGPLNIKSKSESAPNLFKLSAPSLTATKLDSKSPSQPQLTPLKQTTENHHHHHHHHHQHVYHAKELKGAARSSVRIFRGEKSSVLPCTLDTTCKDILDVLRRKRFLKFEDDHILVLKCGGLIRTLSFDEKPLKIQRNMLFLYGYSERDNLDYIERTDLGFLFKFVVQDRGVELISKEKRRMINPQNVNLRNWNLQDIPNFLYAEPIVSLDVSQNPSFEFTKEFMHDCKNLLTLNITGCGNPKFPTCVVYAPRLKELDLDVNYIKQIPNEISMLQTLTSLNLACNRISNLPPSFAELRNLSTLNLSSNRIKAIPEPVLMLSGLKVLDLSYNSIVGLSESMVNLTNLEVLQLSANKLAKKLPDFFSRFSSLIKLDIRFNRIDSIDSLKDLPKLEVIRATGNNISVFTSSADNLFEVELNINPVTYVKFLEVMTKLKIVDFSKGKLTSCSFVSMIPSIEKLTLDNNHLVSLPDEISRMKHLQYLSIFGNNLIALPNAIGRLTKLKYLDLHLNNISTLTSNIWSLEALEYLNISSNLLESFPDPPESLSPFNGIQNLARFSTMKNAQQRQQVQQFLLSSQPSESMNDEALSLEESGNAQPLLHSQQPFSLSAIKRRGSDLGSPSSSAGMMIHGSATGNSNKDMFYGLEKSLKILSMNDNKFSDNVIQTISVFKNLEFLNLSYNELFDIPPGYLCNLSSLKALYLSGNHLSSLPVEDFDSFSDMTTLHLNGNRFHTLPAELSKIKNMTALDVGSNNLKYNIGNIPYDWNWCQNAELNYLNFSGNKRLEIKPQHKREGIEDTLDSFLVLKKLKLLGLMDVTITTDAVPDQGVDVRVRSTVSQLGKFGYGISDTLGQKKSHLTTRDVVIEKFRGQPDEMLITIYDGKNCSDEMGDRISKIIQETFQIHLTKELENVGTSEVAGHPEKKVEDALRGAFLTMNSEMNILINRDQSSTFSSAAAHRTTTTDELTLEQDSLTGCCATVIYIKGDVLYVANIGDTMGIMTKSDGEYQVLTTKHEPYAPEEYERIRESGGYVTTDGYLDGVSDISRAVGFFKLIPHINASPSISKFKLTQSEEMIAIATSEIWKKVPYDLAADIIRQEKSNPGVAAEKLRDFAISYGARDKATAVVLSLRQFTVRQKHQERGSLPEDSILRKLDEEIEPPTGELAMVFTDIKNSTVLWDTYPVAMRSAIKVHNAIMRRQLRIIGGYEVKTEGDAFMVSFPTPTSALLWCFTVQSQLLSTLEWPAEIIASEQGFEIKDETETVIYRGLSVRMGVHWGRPVCERDIVTKRMDYFGPMVNRASRVSSVANGGQITMSTDFYFEFERLKSLHQKVLVKGEDLATAYGSKTLGQILEGQMSQLEQIGWVEEAIGSKKLKGLETPEKIWLIFPKHLAARLTVQTTSSGQVDSKANKLISIGLTTQAIWRLRKLSLRLELICSYLNETAMGPSKQRSDESYREELSKQTEDGVANQLTNVESDLFIFINHVVTRIENCVAVLTMRKVCGSKETGGLNRAALDSLYLELFNMIDQLKLLGGVLPPTAFSTSSMEPMADVVSIEEVK